MGDTNKAHKTHDYNEKLRQDYEEIKRKVERGMLPLVARLPAIDRAVIDYVRAQDEYFEGLHNPPIQFRDSDALERMADLVLYEELKWSHPDKMSIVEYPLMSDTQEDRLMDKTRLHAVIEYKGRETNGRRTQSYIDDNGAQQVSRSRLPEPYDDILDDIDNQLVTDDLLNKAGLTERQRQAVDLVYFEGMTHEEAAEVMGVSRRAVGFFIDVSLSKLKRKFDETTTEKGD